jgi:hypothetical protein
MRRTNTKGSETHGDNPPAVLAGRPKGRCLLGRTEKGVTKRKEGTTPVAEATFGADPMVTEKGRCVKVFVR